jgi:hypothetical protein
MSKFTIHRTTIAMPDAKALEGARALLFGALDGLGEDSKKMWRKFWRKVVNLEPGELCQVEMVFSRNPRFHRKYFALLTLGYDAWMPCMEHNGQRVEKNFEQFREDVTILAGFYTQTWNIDGAMTVRAKSISFASMDDAEFEQVYSAVANVLLERVLTNYEGRAELDRVVEKIVGML